MVGLVLQCFAPTLPDALSVDEELAGVRYGEDAEVDILLLTELPTLSDELIDEFSSDIPCADDR